MFAEQFANVRTKSPLIHNITNYVTVNDCANMVLACGASPIMADDAAEVEDITTICGGIVSTVAGNLGNLTGAAVTLPEEIKTAIDEVGFLASIPLWLVTILGSVFITVLSFVMILTVYSRFFRLYMYTALAPIPLSAFAGDVTANTGRTFIKSYLGVCMEGAVIVLSCLIYSAFLSSSTPAADTTLPAVTMVWQYVGQLVFNMLILTGLVKGADRIVKEMLGL